MAHQRVVAPPERVDQVVEHWATHCPTCQTPLPTGANHPGGMGTYVAHQVTEVPPVHASITEHRRQRVVCPGCQRSVLAVLPPEVPCGAFGPRLQATVALLSGRSRLSRREVADLCSTLLHTPLCVGSVDALCQATSAAVAPAVMALVAAVPDAPVVHSDETGWRQAGKRHWLWVVLTPTFTVFRLAVSRGSAVIRALVGEDYQGTVVSDRYSAYSWLGEERRQVCWAHLQRDFQGLVDRGGAAQPIGQRALAVAHDLFHAWHQFQGGHSDRAGLERAIRPLQATLSQVLTDGHASASPAARSLCRSLDQVCAALWTFSWEDGVSPTNNLAEQAIRPAVLWRKGSFGTQSDGGARFVERLLTVVATCRQQGTALLDYLTDACTATLTGQPPPSLLPVSP